MKTRSIDKVFTSTVVLANDYSVPGSSPKMLGKSQGLNVDCVTYDLEDSVTPSKKAEARKNICHLFDQTPSTSIREQAVRINAIESGLALDDLTEVVRMLI